MGNQAFSLRRAGAICMVFAALMCLAMIVDVGLSHSHRGLAASSQPSTRIIFHSRPAGMVTNDSRVRPVARVAMLQIESVPGMPQPRIYEF